MEAIIPALLELLSINHMFYLSVGVALGLIVGFLPGLGGIAGLSLVLPFLYDMEPSMALAMMIGLTATTSCSDVFPSILIGVPGTSGSQATVIDGFQLSKRGEATRALSAAFSASLFGGCFGALVLTGAIFAARPIILMIGFGEQLMLIVLALSMVGMLTGEAPIKGLAVCGLGLLLGVIGEAPATAELRMTLGTMYLGDGIPLVIVGLGMFALPEIVEVLAKRTTISRTGKLGKGWLQGLKDTIQHRWIVLRCACIGCLVGALPGLGGTVIDWIAYGHVVQTSHDRENFGKGDIRGVLAPEAANNAKEGGALIPTLLFGIPGSGSMAILLGGLVLIGVDPGSNMVGKDINLSFICIWSIALANIMGAGVCFFLAKPAAKLTTIRFTLIAPIMIVLIFFAEFTTHAHKNQHGKLPVTHEGKHVDAIADTAGLHHDDTPGVAQMGAREHGNPFFLGCQGHGMDIRVCEGTVDQHFVPGVRDVGKLGDIPFAQDTINFFTPLGLIRHNLISFSIKRPGHIHQQLQNSGRIHQYQVV